MPKPNESRYADISHDYLKKSFEARVHAAQDRVMGLRAREVKEPKVALARQQAEQSLDDLKHTQRERLTGIDRIRIARHGPVRHVASCLVLPPNTAEDRFPEFAEDPQHAELRRRIELAAEENRRYLRGGSRARVRTCRPSQDRLRHSKLGTSQICRLVIGTR